MKDLEAASIEDVRDFFRTYYVPNNATLVLVGDFDTKEATALVQQYLGAFRSPRGRCRAIFPRSRRRPRAPRAPRNWPLPVVVVAYHITFDGNPDSSAHIASKVLSDGESSRIYRKLVYEEAARPGGVWRRQHHRGPEPVLRGGDRAAGAEAGGRRQCADRRAGQGCALSRSRRPSSSRPRISGRATTS